MSDQKSLKFLECLPRGEWLSHAQLRKCASAVMINPDLVLRRVSVLLKQGLLEHRIDGVGKHLYRVREDFAEAQP